MDLRRAVAAMRAGPVPTALVVAIIPVAFFASCTSFKIALDRCGVQDIVDEMTGGDPGDPAVLRALVASHHLANHTAPMGGEVRDEGPLEDWTVEIGEDGVRVVPRLLRFASPVNRADQSDSGVFYYYETTPGDRAIVWAPGMGFADFALRFIDEFFIAALEQGWSVAVWVPPYHQERRLPQVDAGAGFLTADPAANVQLMLVGVRELRTMTAWLRGRGALRVGGWGGSMGAAMLLLAASVEPLDHVTVMIPVLDWRALALQHELMAPAVLHLTQAGYDLPLLRDAYALLSPVRHHLLVPSSRVQILYARHDQLTPESTILDYAAARGITAVHGYDQSHATILLESDIHRDYRGFLEQLGSSSVVPIQVFPSQSELDTR